MPSPPTTTAPVSTGYVQVGRELTRAVVAPVFTTVKCKPLTVSNKPQWLEDAAMWGDMNELHDLQQGPRWAELEIPESPLYGDTFGHFAFGFFGDQVTTGTAGTPTWMTSGTLAAGATTIPVTSGSSAVAGTFVQVDTGVNAEVVTVGTGSTATSIVVSASTPLRFSHATTVAVVTVTAPFVSTFTTLNPASSTGLTDCQPPSHSIVHHNYLPGSGGYYADLFLYAVVTELTISGKASGWLTWSAKMTSYIQTAPGQAITSALSQVKGIPAWKSTNTIASSAYNGISEWSATWTRKPDVIPAADGVQDPYFLGLGQIGSSFKLTYDPAIDESALVSMLQNTQPSLAWSASNGGSGASLISLAISSQLAGYTTADLKATKEFWGYDAQGKFVASSAGAGNSGGTTLSQLALTSNVPGY